MISLIRNELKKIFKKNTLYVILLITIGVCIFSNVMTKKFSNSNELYSEIDLQGYQESLKYAKESGDVEYIRDCESYIEAHKIANKYDKNAWQRYVVQSKLQPIIYDMLIAGEESDEYTTYKENYDKIIKNLEQNNWKAFVEDELKDINSELKLVENKEMVIDDDTLESLKDQKRVLEWRLEKEISYGNSDLNKYLENYLSAKASLREFEKVKEETHSLKIEKEECIETIKICEYAIENKIDSNITMGGNDELQYDLSINANTELLRVFDSLGFFVIIAVIIISGTIVSEESNKGTIKLLLVRPYKRTKILLAKFISAVIILVISLVFIVAIQGIVGGAIFGFGSYSEKIVMYNFNSNSIELVSGLRYLVMSAICILPMYLLLMVLSFTISTVLTNAPMAIAIPLLGTMGADIINSLLTVKFEKVKFLLYFVTPNWDLSIYAFGKTPTFEIQTLPFSIVICLVYFVVLLGLSMFVFKKRDIKNV